MFKIRREHRAAFRADALADFEARVLEHLARALPRASAALGDEGLRATMRRGMERAAAHGFSSERDVCSFVDLWVIFGEDFDRRLPWASAILGAPSPVAPGRRMRMLLDRAEVEA